MSKRFRKGVAKLVLATLILPVMISVFSNAVILIYAADPPGGGVTIDVSGIEDRLSTIMHQLTDSTVDSNPTVRNYINQTREYTNDMMLVLTGQYTGSDDIYDVATATKTVLTEFKSNTSRDFEDVKNLQKQANAELTHLNATLEALKDDVEAIETLISSYHPMVAEVYSGNNITSVYYRPKLDELPNLQEYIQLGLRSDLREADVTDKIDSSTGLKFVTAYTGFFDVDNKDVPKLETGTSRELEILGYDFLLSNSYYSYSDNAFKENVMDLDAEVMYGTAVMDIYKAIGNEIVEYFPVYKYDPTITMESSPAVLALPSIITNAKIDSKKHGYSNSDGGFAGSSNSMEVTESGVKGYKVTVYATRTNLASYTSKANEDMQISGAKCLEAITGADFLVLLARMMDLYGEPVMTDLEQNTLLQFYGDEMPPYLTSEQKHAYVYLRSRGIIEEDFGFASNLKLRDMLTVLMRVKDNDSRLTFKNVQPVITLGDTMVAQGYYPQKSYLTSGNENLNPTYSNMNLVSNYYDFYFYLGDDSKYTKINLPSDQKVPTSSAQAGFTYLGKVVLGNDNRLMYHVQIPVKLLEDPNVNLQLYALTNNPNDTPLAMTLSDRDGGIYIIQPSLTEVAALNRDDEFLGAVLRNDKLEQISRFPSYDVMKGNSTYSKLDIEYNQLSTVSDVTDLAADIQNELQQQAANQQLSVANMFVALIIGKPITAYAADEKGATKSAEKALTRFCTTDGNTTPEVKQLARQFTTLTNTQAYQTQAATDPANAVLTVLYGLSNSLTSVSTVKQGVDTLIDKIVQGNESVLILDHWDQVINQSELRGDAIFDELLDVNTDGSATILLKCKSSDTTQIGKFLASIKRSNTSVQIQEPVYTITSLNGDLLVEYSKLVELGYFVGSGETPEALDDNETIIRLPMSGGGSVVINKSTAEIVVGNVVYKVKNSQANSLFDYRADEHGKRVLWVDSRVAFGWNNTKASAKFVGEGSAYHLELSRKANSDVSVLSVNLDIVPAFQTINSSFKVDFIPYQVLGVGVNDNERHASFTSLTSPYPLANYVLYVKYNESRALEERYVGIFYLKDTYNWWNTKYPEDQIAMPDDLDKLKQDIGYDSFEIPDEWCVRWQKIDPITDLAGTTGKIIYVDKYGFLYVTPLYAEWAGNQNPDTGYRNYLSGAWLLPYCEGPGGTQFTIGSGGLYNFNLNYYPGCGYGCRPMKGNMTNMTTMNYLGIPDGRRVNLSINSEFVTAAPTSVSTLFGLQNGSVSLADELQLSINELKSSTLINNDSTRFYFGTASAKVTKYRSVLITEIDYKNQVTDLQAKRTNKLTLSDDDNYKFVNVYNEVKGVANNGGTLQQSYYTLIGSVFTSSVSDEQLDEIEVDGEKAESQIIGEEAVIKYEDWSRFEMESLIDKIDGGSTLIIYFAFQILPLIGVILVTILVGFTLLSKNKFVELICDKTIDPIKLLTFGKSNIHDISVKHALISLIIAYCAFALILNGNLLRIIIFLVEAFAKLAQILRGA